jgi:hypothetical protein
MKGSWWSVDEYTHRVFSAANKFHVKQKPAVSRETSLSCRAAKSTAGRALKSANVSRLLVWRTEWVLLASALRPSLYGSGPGTRREANGVVMEGCQPPWPKLLFPPCQPLSTASQPSQVWGGITVGRLAAETWTRSVADRVACRDARSTKKGGNPLRTESMHCCWRDKRHEPAQSPALPISAAQCPAVNCRIEPIEQRR